MLQSINRFGYGGSGFSSLGRILKELQSFKVDGPFAGATANTLIPVSDIKAADTISKALFLSGGTFTDITANVSVASLGATGTLTLNGVVAGDTAVVNGKTYTAVAFNRTLVNGNVLPFQFAVGANNAATAQNLADAINASDPVSITATAAAAVVTVTADTDGTGGNSIGLVGGARLTASGSTLAGGSATNGIKSTSSTAGGQVLIFWYASQSANP